MNNGVEEVASFADNKSGWQIWAIWAVVGCEFGFAIWTKVGVTRNYVFFTTVAKWISDVPAPHTGVRREEV